MLQIRSLELENRFIMAPMAGITDSSFRRIVKRLGAGLVYTEMVSAAGIRQNNKRTFSYLHITEEERPTAAQIFGSTPDTMAFAAEKALKSGADIIDINMGCPVKKVVKSGAGAALLLEPARAGEIVSEVRRVCGDSPITVKMRSGWSDDRPAGPDFAKMLEDHGADGVAVHGRYAKQGFSGTADWNQIARIKASLNIPVIGNGDVFEPLSALRITEDTDCDGVMIGRGAIGNPWIFQQVMDIEKGLPPRGPTFRERRDLILEHCRLLTGEIGRERSAPKIRGLLFWYTKGLPSSSRFRESIGRTRDINGLLKAMDEYFSRLEETPS